MIAAVVIFVVLIVLARNELSLKEIIGVVAFLILAGGIIVVLQLHPLIFMSIVAVADIYLVLKLFGSDITIN